MVILRSAARNLAPVNPLCQRGATEHGVVAYNKQKKSTGGAWTLAHKVNIGALYNYFPHPPQSWYSNVYAGYEPPNGLLIYDGTTVVRRALFSPEARTGSREECCFVEEV